MHTKYNFFQFCYIKDKHKFPAKKTKLVLVDPHYGCDKPKNAYQLKGNVAFVKRGFVFILYIDKMNLCILKYQLVCNSECSFLQKTVISEKCGAKAIVITDNNIYDDSYIHMVDDESELSANIPAGFLVGKSGLVILFICL